MNSTKTWLAELLYALKTLPRNPYLLHRWQKITRPRTLLAVVSAYVVFTIAHVSVNSVIVSSPLDLGAWLILDLALQITYLQQQACLFIIGAVVIPISTLMKFIKEKEQNHIAFILLTPSKPSSNNTWDPIAKCHYSIFRDITSSTNNIGMFFYKQCRDILHNHDNYRFSNNFFIFFDYHVFVLVLHFIIFLIFYIPFENL